MQPHAKMADFFPVLLHLVLMGIASSEITKLKSNPNGNFAIGFEKGYINSGMYGVIVPKGDESVMREVQIRGPVRDSVTMEFNSRTIVFSGWDGMFMLGDKVYTDKLGTLYFVRSDKKCVRKVYRKQMGEIQVVEKEDLDKIVCEAVRTKVETAVSEFINSPFKYLLPTASDKLKHTAGFPGGDFIQGLKHGDETCGQHTVDVPTGDEDKEKTIKITAPGVADEIKMIFDSDTKVYGSWDGVFFLGDKVFSVQPKTLVFKKEDGSCVKKHYVSKGSEIVVDRSVLLKQEDCFLIMSQAYGAMQTHRKPSLSADKDKIKKKKKKMKHSSSSEDSDSTPKKKSAAKKKKSSSSKQQSPPPIHVTSTVVIPKENQPQQGIPTVASPSTIIVPLQSNTPQPQLMALPGTQTQNYYVPNSNNQYPAMVPLTQNVQAPLLYTSQIENTPQEDGMLGGSDKIVNIQNNDIDLNTLGQPFTLQSIDPNKQEVLPGGYIRIGRSVSPNSSPGNVVNTQELDIDESAILKAREGKSDTKIVGIQKSNIISPTGNIDSPDMKTTQITTVTLPSNKESLNDYKKSNDNGTPQDIYVDTNVILDQDSQPKSNKDDLTILPVKSIPVAVSSEVNKVVNIQNSHVTLGQQGSAVNIQKNVVKLNNPTLVNGFIPVLEESNTPKLLVRIARNVENSDSNNVINFQDNDVNLIGSGDVKNIQRNNVNVEGPNPTYMVSPKGSLLVDIPNPTKVLNIEDNNVNVDGLSDVKNIQTNKVGLRSLGIPVVLPTVAPQVLVRVPRKVENDIYVQQLSPKKVLNYQNNNVRLDGGGSVKNIQLNKVDEDYLSLPKIVKKRSTPIFGVARTNLQPIYVKNNPNEVVNLQKNDVNLNGPGYVTNIQKNIVDAEQSANILVGSKDNPSVLMGATKDINVQNNDVTLNGFGDVKNIQTNDVHNNQPAAFLVGKRRKRSIPQDVLNNQLVTIDGTSVGSSSSQGGKILALQGNDIIAPVGLDGNPIYPNMKSSQVTKLVLPPQPGSPRSQMPQNMYIKTNVLYKQNPQQSQPIYIQASPANSNSPTILQVAPPPPPPQPQTIVVSPQTQVPSQTVFYANNQRPILVPTASLQGQPSGSINQQQRPTTYVIANVPTAPSPQVHPGGVVHTVRQPNGEVQSFTVVNSPASASSSGQGRIPVTLMKDLTMLKRMYNPSNMIVNIAQNTNFHKK